MRSWIGGPLHPGGAQATDVLLDLADVGAETRLIDLGCGDGAAVRRARDRGAEAVGLDRDGPVCGLISDLPLATDSFDVAISECALCLADDLDAALAEARRILDDGRLAFSDVTLEADLDVPPTLAEPLCLQTARPRSELLDAVERAGFDIVRVDDRADDVHAFRDRVRNRVDVDGLLASLGDAGKPYRRGVQEIEAALDDGALGYVHVLADA